jgi:hypothetical protein
MAKVQIPEQFKPTHHYDVPCMNGEIDYDANTNRARFHAQNLVIHLKQVERISTVDDGSVLIFSGKDRFETTMLLDSTGRIYLKRLLAADLPPEPVVDIESLTPDGTLPRNGVSSTLKRTN